MFSNETMESVSSIERTHERTHGIILSKFLTDCTPGFLFHLTCISANELSRQYSALPVLWLPSYDFCAVGPIPLAEKYTGSILLEPVKYLI
jgi:hypothetical protein